MLSFIKMLLLTQIPYHEIYISVMVFTHSTKFLLCSSMQVILTDPLSPAHCFISSSCNILYLSSNLQEGIHITTSQEDGHSWLQQATVLHQARKCLRKKKTERESAVASNI